jgi:hypothetical protein
MDTGYITAAATPAEDTPREHLERLAHGESDEVMLRKYSALRS